MGKQERKRKATTKNTTKKKTSSWFKQYFKEVKEGQLAGKRMLCYTLAIKHPRIEKPLVCPVMAPYDKTFNAFDHQQLWEIGTDDICKSLANYFRQTIDEVQFPITSGVFWEQESDAATRHCAPIMFLNDEFIKQNVEDQTGNRFGQVEIVYAHDLESYQMRTLIFPDEKSYLDYNAKIFDTIAPGKMGTMQVIECSVDRRY